MIYIEADTEPQNFSLDEYTSYMIFYKKYTNQVYNLTPGVWEGTWKAH